MSNLLELYIHDLSAAFPEIELGADGRFGYRPLALYWSQPDRRFAFLIRCDDRIAGFALVTRGSPATDDPDVFDVAEFFILRRYRRAGVGRQAAEQLWTRQPGRWIVRVFEGNSGAVSFWSHVIEGFTGKAETVIELSDLPDRVKNEYRNAKRYKIGRSLSITMSDQEDVINVIRLIDIKIRLK